MKKILFLLPLIAWIVMASCSQGKTENPPTSQKSLNPNGDSELALLMRQMYEVGMQMKDHIQKGEKPAPDIPYQTILTATPTDEAFTSDPNFPDFAQSYIDAMDNLKKAENDNVHLFYTSMVNTCMNCHQDMCPGPMVKIKKLYLEDSTKEM